MGGTTPVIVVEVGPETVCGPEAVPQDTMTAALACIDDRLALIDDRAVDVDELWCDVLGHATGDHDGTIAIVTPTWWPAGRIRIVAAAAEEIFAEAVVLQRSILARDSDATVVELSADFAVVTPPASDCRVLDRDDAEVEAHLTAAPSVLVDVPEGVAPLCADVLARLRQRGIPVSYSARHRMRDAAARAIPEVPCRRRRTVARPGRRTIAVMTGVAVTTAAVVGGWAAQTFTPQRAGGDATRLLTEGRVELSVPATWAAERVTDDAVTARVRVSAPGGLPALHITQSSGAQKATLDVVAETLRHAIASEPAGVFVDFEAAADRGGRPAVTYVERRAGTETRWAVVVDGVTRIAIGCQHASAHRASIEAICDEAVRSVHVPD
ncbi:type VII secretion-associated protein [Mycobacterium sp. 236(2023)]|uniref:type VII secretion-associated protein n=1 Tax=Mycobacterium sp. 236(2023) TaxID=3038163 RepID=UPI002414FAE8|nr:type VII secretion-associated protein [Mycobacterium sp. 236(2023)]MDG4664016.1 type VII secretion-associated protein [Mycobacterium sp. 236(2023)]